MWPEVECVYICDDMFAVHVVTKATLWSMRAREQRLWTCEQGIVLRGESLAQYLADYKLDQLTFLEQLKQRGIPFYSADIEEIKRTSNEVAVTYSLYKPHHFKWLEAVDFNLSGRAYLVTMPFLSEQNSVVSRTISKTHYEWLCWRYDKPSFFKKDGRLNTAYKRKIKLPKIYFSTAIPLPVNAKGRERASIIRLKDGKIISGNLLYQQDQRSLEIEGMDLHFIVDKRKPYKEIEQSMRYTVPIHQIEEISTVRHSRHLEARP